MKILQFDSIGGASGDMILASLLDLGVNRRALLDALTSLRTGAFDVRARRVVENGLRGIQVRVTVPEHGRRAHHLHRTFKDIRSLIRRSRLPEPVKDMSIRVFRRLAEAEAAVHNTVPNRIAFHEVGAVDSIADVVGSCLALHTLDVRGVVVGLLPMSYGTVKSAHGILPVPAPATVELLKGHPIVQTAEPFELVTPTGAALLMTWKTLEAPPPGSRILKAGYGFGHRDLQSRPNLLRAFLLDIPQLPNADELCLVMECNLDDMTPQMLGYLMQRLLDAGALDAFITPVQMKKQRLGALVTVLCRPGDRNALLDMLFSESTTFGVREHLTSRTVLERRRIWVRTPFGRVRVKLGRREGKLLAAGPEYEDCVKRAQACGVPLRRVYESALAAIGRKTR